MTLSICIMVEVLSLYENYVVKITSNIYHNQYDAHRILDGVYLWHRGRVV